MLYLLIQKRPYEIICNFSKGDLNHRFFKSFFFKNALGGCCILYNKKNNLRPVLFYEILFKNLMQNKRKIIIRCFLLWFNFSKPLEIVISEINCIWKKDHMKLFVIFKRGDLNLLVFLSFILKMHLGGCCILYNKKNNLRPVLFFDILLKNLRQKQTGINY